MVLRKKTSSNIMYCVWIREYVLSASKSRILYTITAPEIKYISSSHRNPPETTASRCQSGSEDGGGGRLERSVFRDENYVR
jgi:hypothetical protein